jgi:hypothetical protein
MLENFEQPTTSAAYGCRSWLYMLLNLGLGTAYFTFMILGYMLGFGLSLIWIGLPILALMLVLTRRIASFDRWIASKFIGIKLAKREDDLHTHNANPLHLVGAHLTSATTWQDAVYLMMKLPLGITSFTMAIFAAPFFFFELLLTLLGINTGMITGRIMRAMAAGLSGTMGGLNPAVEPTVQYVAVPVREEKAKRRLELDDESGYFIDDDGEIGLAKQKR